MSRVSGQPNLIRDYIWIDEILTRPLQLSPMPARDIYHGRSLTVLEEALESAFYNTTLNLGLSISKNPDQCPPESLPALAVETGVNGWYVGTSIKGQREVIKTSKALHRSAGTLRGITAAIKDLGVEAIVTATYKPYELLLVTTTNFTPELSESLVDRIERYKSERDVIRFERHAPASAQTYRAEVSLITAGYHSCSVYPEV